MGILSWLFGDTIHYHTERCQHPNSEELEKLKTLKKAVQHANNYKDWLDRLPTIDYSAGHEYVVRRYEGKSNHYLVCRHCGLEKFDVELNETYCLKYHFKPKKNRHGSYEGPLDSLPDIK